MGVTNPQFWKGKRVMVTGHTGFKGAWLAKWLQSMDASVAGFALEPGTRPNAFEAMRCGTGMQSFIADIRDYRSVRRAMKAFEPQVVFHLAAQSLVREGYADLLGTYMTNVMGTANVLQAARDNRGIRAIVSVTSDKCYENRGLSRGYREGDPLGGYDPYSSSKAGAELVTSAFARSFFREKVAIATARAGNVIGGGDWAKDRLVPDLVRGARRGRPVLIRNPVATRPWQHVLEPLSGYLVLAEALFRHGERFEGAWNFGPAGAGQRRVSWVADQFVRAWGRGASWTFDRRHHPHEAALLNVDSTKANRRLSWRPRWRAEVAIAAAVAWYKDYYAGADMGEGTVAQIRMYVERKSRQRRKVS